jgi:hypothetical protein
MAVEDAQAEQAQVHNAALRERLEQAPGVIVVPPRRFLVRHDGHAQGLSAAQLYANVTFVCSVLRVPEGFIALAFDFYEFFGEGATVQEAVQELTSKAEETLEFSLNEFACARVPSAAADCDIDVFFDQLELSMDNSEVAQMLFTVFSI